MRSMKLLALAMVATALGATTAVAQEQAHDPSAKLREVLPSHVAEQVLATIANARARGLPTVALERTALKGAARNVTPEDIQAAVAAQAARLDASRAALTANSGGRPAGDDEIEAGAEALRKGVDGAGVSELAKSAPSGRSLAVPLYVIGTLVERGLPSDDALAAVQARLSARATDAQIAELPDQVAASGGKPATTGRELAGTRRAAGGAPVTVPANAGAGAKPTVTPPARPTPPRP
jgi:hypothetical protein